METTLHRVYYGDSRDLGHLDDGSVDFVLTSPPYPMIPMWDASFARQDDEIGRMLDNGDGAGAFRRMHALLDPVWRECFRLLRPGGMACINIGDAVRTLNGRFGLYPNHAAILTACTGIGFTALPLILWRKQTNAPNKFMGSGMLPAGAYVTLEHEYVLIFRKGDKREFASEADRQRRKESAIFWEERNAWFSDVWLDLKGTGQGLPDAAVRRRSGAFPFELAYRLIQMFSVRGDTVLDPFAGTGTSVFAAMASGRHSIGVELESGLHTAVASGVGTVRSTANARISARLSSHLAFIRERFQDPETIAHVNRPYGFAVVTRQETDLVLFPVHRIRKTGEHTFEVDYVPEAVIDPKGYEQRMLF
ncbi:MAG: DNA-methyltransferase [Desulfobacterales bacterium]